MPPTPFGDDDDFDTALVQLVCRGDQGALEALIERHRPWIYNVALRMVYVPQDADDAAQEILIKVVTGLSSFDGRSRLRTWLYRIAVNHLLNMKRTRAEEMGYTFERDAEGLDSTPGLDLPDPSTVPADVQLLVDEARIGCTMGMLLCLDREQRLAYVLGEIFAVTDAVGAELLDVSRDAFINAGFVDPANLLFAASHVTRVRERAPKLHDDINALDAAYAAVHRDHPFQTPPALAGAIRDLFRRR